MRRTGRKILRDRYARPHRSTKVTNPPIREAEGSSRRHEKLFRYPAALCSVRSTRARRAGHVMHMRDYRRHHLLRTIRLRGHARASAMHSRCAMCQYTPEWISDVSLSLCPKVSRNRARAQSSLFANRVCSLWINWPRSRVDRVLSIRGDAKFYVPLKVYR